MFPRYLVFACFPNTQARKLLRMNLANQFLAGILKCLTKIDLMLYFVKTALTGNFVKSLETQKLLNVW